ncbi:hypothetical protein BFP76_02510 [Amylibacter kogurei]|uniref:Uracil-DNA glycosylase-like domain-containing protein n=1 Tax=Paramylibacter kogurei TaxID=1889778 RepID=A0A2G5K3N3_9RHOB|nr:hypothetical protein BFP76_02510 [Amylibacter kogurei]
MEAAVLSYEFWDKQIASEAERLGFDDGYKILYGPWETIGNSDTVFLSLNPGCPPHGADLFSISDERGNSYEVEKYTTLSPITAQFLALADLLELQPKQILTGTVAPFRSNRWMSISLSQRRGALEVGKRFWEDVFATNRPKRVICCCPQARKITSEILDATLEMTISSGWGNTSLHRFRAKDGALIAQIPHLSTFKLLSRPACIAPLKLILDL